MFTRKKSKKWLLAVLAVGLLAAALLGIRLYGNHRRIPENVTLGGLEIGGMTCQEAKTAVKDAAEKGLLTKKLSLILPEETLVFSPEEAGLKLNTLEALRDALRLESGEENRSLGLLPYLSREEAYFQNALLGYAQKHDTELTQSLWRLDGDRPELETDRFDPNVPVQTISITLGIPERHLDQAEALQAIWNFYDGALTAEEFTVSLDVPPEKLPDAPDLSAIYESCCVSPVDDSLDMERFQPVPGTYGCAFDLDEAKEKWKKPNGEKPFPCPWRIRSRKFLVRRSTSGMS